jgi:hypothetical protein
VTARADARSSNASGHAGVDDDQPLGLMMKVGFIGLGHMKA